ncbi:repeat protein [Candidatus Thiomargarita nelsonii]|uniref:Repeat protein n=1 Tax=Candidatus Thiomargarita nelsonii TaxID=1003181 RepID=A0A176S467_9GAMM|nr:repeat protein [Candidatus Thiomargarita nelsonii]
MKLKIFVWIISLITLCSLVPGSLNDLFAQASSLSAEQKEQLKLAEAYDAQIEQYYEQGLFKKFFKKALPLAKNALKIRNEILGEKHPDTLESLGNLAMIYYEFSRESDALPLLEKSYSLRKEVLGEKHPDTLESLGNLAMIYYELDRLSEALSLLEKNYSLRKEVLGS